MEDSLYFEKIGDILNSLDNNLSPSLVHDWKDVSLHDTHFTHTFQFYI